MKTTARILQAAILSALLIHPASAAIAQNSNPFIPRLTGLIKTNFENDVNTGDVRFAVKNARLGIGGVWNTSHGAFRYQFQAELNAEGKFNILDTYAAYSTGSFEVSAGQQQYRFGTELNRGPRFNYFADPSFLTSYIGSYYGNPAQTGGARGGNLGARDIGVIFRYGNKTSIPINISAGFVNGSGINNPLWSKSLNFVARLWLDPHAVTAGVGAAVNFYVGNTPFGDRINMIGAELRYIGDRWRVEGEYARRNLALSESTDRLDLAAVHAIYFQRLDGWGPVKFLAPMARWDYGNNIPLLTDGPDPIHFNAQRATAGLTVGFAETLLKCELRFNYQHCFPSLAEAADNPAFRNKFIVEFFLAF